MGQCINHPDRDTSYQCQKHQIYLCDECLKCRDLELYCKFRSACPIHFMSEKGGKDWMDDSKADDSGRTAINSR